MKKIKILLVEDDLFLRDVYLEILESVESFEVDFAGDGQTAYEKLSKGGWDLVMMDVVLPGYSGIDVMKKFTTEEVKKLSKHIVFMTNSDDHQELKEVIDMVEDFWMKSSFTPDQLLNKIKSVVSQ